MTKKNISKKRSLENRFELGVGGQAVIEGVMMRCKDKYSVAVRKPNDKISLKKDKISSWTTKPFFKLPFIRGLVMLIETLILGIKTLNYSANESLDEVDEKISTWELIATTAVSLLFAIGLFLLLPLYLTKLTATDGFWFNLIDGVIRIAIFVLYIVVISMMADVKTLFQYHGAEHKAVACFEAGEKVTVKNAKKYSTVHRRCGTTFLIIVLVISILIFSLIVTDSFWIKLLGRILLMPVIAGISYELLKFGAKYPKFILLRILVAPGLWLQRLTTREPTNRQLEVSVKALNAVVKS
jgi:uncharacterized protein YqhQ